MNLIQRIDRFTDKVIEWIYERCRDHTRDELCTALQSLGINAQMSERGRPEEEITSRWFESIVLGVKYLGIIDIQNPMISWVGIKKHETKDSEGGGSTYYEIEYGIPYSASSPDFSKVRIRTEHKKRKSRNRIEYRVWCKRKLKKHLSSFMFEETFKFSGTDRVLELANGFGLDLPDTFTSNLEYSTDFFQCISIAVTDSISQLNNLAFSV